MIKHRIKTWGDFEKATFEERRRWAREYIAQGKRAYQRELQEDVDADRRAFEIGLVDDPGPGQQIFGIQSSTRRISNL